MDQQFADSIRSRLIAEKTRTSYPEGFPALPPIPCRAVLRSGILQAGTRIRLW